jgi:multiple sugar transport system permease protein
MKTKNKMLSQVLIYIILGLMAVVFFFPFFWMLRTSVSGITDLFSPDAVLLPSQIMWENFKQALTSQPFGLFFINSTVIAVANIIGVLLTSSLCAYGFSRIDWPGRDTLFGILLSALMLPYVVLMIPQFVGWKSLGLTDTYAPLVVPAFFGGGLFNIFLLRQFFLSIPREIDEAARIDGAGHLRIYASIILPLAKQAMVVVALFTFLNSWNDYLTPVLYLSSEKKYTLMLGLTLFQGSYSAQWHLMMAAVAIIVIPSLIFFLIAQKFLVEGIATTGIKG